MKWMNECIWYNVQINIIADSILNNLNLLFLLFLLSLNIVNFNDNNFTTQSLDDRNWRLLKHTDALVTRYPCVNQEPGNMILQFTHFHNFSSLLRLWSTTLNGLEFHQKILNDSMAVLLWQYDTIWQYFCDSMTARPRTWLHHCMTDPLHAKFRRSGKKTWPPRKIASQIWTPKNQDASLYSTFWSRVRAVHWFVTETLPGPLIVIK